MDIFDRAQEADELFRQVALKDHFSRQGQKPESEVQQYPGGVPAIDISGPSPSGPRLCLDCGKRISAARLAANPKAVRCVGCQTLKERS